MKRMGHLATILTVIITLAVLPMFVTGQANLRQPVIRSTSLLNLTWTAGTVNNGGKAVTIAAGSTNGTASRTDCAAPTFTTCGWLYADSAGTVANTTTRATAAASGNTILAMYESNGTTITKLSFPLQSSMLSQAAVGTLTGATLVTPNIGAATGTSLDLTGSLDVGVAGTTVGTVVMNNATSGTITLSPATGALGTVTATLPAATGTVMLSTLATNAPDVANSVTGASAALVFEGTADASETSLTVTDPTADRTVTVPDSTFTLGQFNSTYTMLANGSLADQSFFLATRAYIVTAISEVHSVAGNDAGAVNIQVTKDTSTNAPGAGTDLLTNNANAGFDAKGTANTVQTGTLAAAAALTLAAGDRLSVDFAGTLTTLAGVTVTVTLQPIN